MRLERRSFEGASREAAERFVRRAERQERIDVGYGEVDSPLGRLVVAVTSRGLVRVGYGEEALDDVARRLSPRILRVPRRVDPARRQLERYFAGRLRRFDIDLDWSLTNGFSRRVLRAAARIPFGEVSTYREVAARAGSPRGSRAAGNALGSNPIPIIVPCHRVLHTAGGLGGYTGGLDRKEFLLRLEGVLPPLPG